MVEKRIPIEKFVDKIVELRYEKIVENLVDRKISVDKIVDVTKNGIID